MALTNLRPPFAGGPSFPPPQFAAGGQKPFAANSAPFNPNLRLNRPFGGPQTPGINPGLNEFGGPLMRGAPPPPGINPPPHPGIPGFEFVDPGAGPTGGINGGGILGGGVAGGTPTPWQYTGTLGPMTGGGNLPPGAQSMMGPMTGGVKPQQGGTPPIIGPQIHPLPPPNAGGGGKFGPAPTKPINPNFEQGPQTQQFGLSGAENAIRQGLGGAIGAIGQGTQGGLNTLQTGFNQAQSSLDLGRQALQGLGSSDTSQALNFLRGGGGGFGGVGNIGTTNASAVNVDEQAGQGLFREGAGGINQFTGAGVSAQQRQAMLSGALGAEKQAQAFADFNASPEQAFLREQGELSRVNQAAATGGVGGGELLKDLTAFGTGIAAQDFQNQFNRLGQLSNQGLQAATSAGNLLGQAGQQQGRLAGQNAQLGTQVNLSNAQAANQAALTGANLANQAGMQGAQINATLAGQGANLLQQSQQNDLNRQLQSAQAQAGMFGQEAGLAGSLAGQGAGMQFGAGQNIGGLLSGAGQQIGGLRSQAGRDLAGQFGSTSQGLADLINQQGSGLSDLIGSGAANIGQLLTGAGGVAGGSQESLARLLANLSVGQGQTAGNMALAGGNTAANLSTAQTQANQDSLAQLMNIWNNRGG